MRGGSWNNNRDNARCAIRNRNHPGNRNNNIGFRVVLRSPTFFRPFFWFRRKAGRRAGLPGRSRSGNAGRSADWFAEAKEEEQRQTGLVRARPGAT